MTRGKPAPDGATYVSQNGYHYTKDNGKFKATHVLIMEKHLGRELEPIERVRFKNGDKTDLRVENLRVDIKGKASLETQRARLCARIEELQAQLDEVEKQIELRASKARIEKLESSSN